MKITEKWLEEKMACKDGVKWFLENGLSDHIQIIDLLIYQNHADWANWLITKMFKTKKQKVKYAIFAAELVIDIYEKNGNSKAPRKAIEAAKKYLKNPSKKSKKAAYSAAVAAFSAAYAVYSPYYSSAHAAYSAAYSAAYDAAYDAAAAAHAAAAAAVAAVAVYAKKEIYIKIIKYGLTLL